jgi:hypothetical protein
MENSFEGLTYEERNNFLDWQIKKLFHELHASDADKDCSNKKKWFDLQHALNERGILV